MSKAGERLIQSALEAVSIAEGTADPNTYVEHDVPVLDVRAIRKKFGLTQPEFAAAYGIPIDTLRGWEQGKRQPDGPTRAYLRAIERIPAAIRDALAA